LARNDVPALAIYQLVAYIVEKKIAVKIIKVIVAHWLNILCNLGGVKWRIWYQRTVNVTQLLTCTFIYRSLSTRKAI